MSNDEGKETDSLLDIAELSPQSARRMQVTDMPVSLEGCSGGKRTCFDSGVLLLFSNMSNWGTMNRTPKYVFPDCARHRH